MAMSAEQRNELDRAKHTKATRMTLYELGMLIGALNVADKVAGIGSKYAGVPLAVAVAAGIGVIIFASWRREGDRKVFDYLDDELAKDAAQLDESTAGAEGSP